MIEFSLVNLVKIMNESQLEILPTFRLFLTELLMLFDNVQLISEMESAITPVLDRYMAYKSSQCFFFFIIIFALLKVKTIATMNKPQTRICVQLHASGTIEKQSARDVLNYFLRQN